MVSPAFFGMYNAQRGIMAAQVALNVIGHNVANVNTPGYSRQRVNLSAAVPYASPTLTTVANMMQQGQGVAITSITRAREGTLDDQFRQLNMQQGTDSAVYSGLRGIQGVIAETETTGLSTAIQKFFASTHELSTNPDNMAARNNFMLSAQEMMNEFKARANQLQDLQDSLVANAPDSELTTTVSAVNEKLRYIAELNKEIGTVTSIGGQPNDLLDQRDQAMDDLSGLVDFTTTVLPNSQIQISIGGQMMVNRSILTDTLSIVTNPGPVPSPDSVPSLVQTTTGAVVLNNGAGPEITGGKIRGLLDVGGQSTGSSTNIRGMLEDLDDLAVAIVGEVNALQATGRDLNGALGAANLIFTPAAPVTPPLAIFQYGVNATVLANTSLIAAAADDATAPANFAGQGDGRNALLMAQLKDKTITAFPATPLNATFEDYLESRVASMAGNTSIYQTRTQNGAHLMNEVNLRRTETSGVNMDQELSDMMRFQRGFEASSKVMKVMDDTLQTILNLV